MVLHELVDGEDVRLHCQTVDVRAIPLSNLVQRIVFFDYAYRRFQQIVPPDASSPEDASVLSALCRELSRCYSEVNRREGYGFSL